MSEQDDRPLLPDTTSDERDPADPYDTDADDLERLRREVPPHHGGG